MNDPLLLDLEDGVLTITFNAPETRNALTMPLRELLFPAVEEAAADPAVRCVVLKGAGGHFMSGGDIRNFGELLKMGRAEREAYFLERIPRINRMIQTLISMEKPVLASVSGAAAGAGLSLMLACDMAVADESAFCSMAYRHIALSPDAGGTWLLPRVVGLRRAMEISLLGERIPAQDCLRLGLFNRVVAPEALEAETLKLARSLADGPQAALAATKRLVHAAYAREAAPQLQAEAESFARLSATADWEEGVRAFLEKRKARF